jgi:hypothetical protein
MADFFPTYRRGESLVGYAQRCSSSRDLVNVVPSPTARIELCREHAQEVRDFQPRQPFSKTGKIVSSVRSLND